MTELRGMLDIIAQANLPHVALPGASFVNSRQTVSISWVWINPFLDLPELDPDPEAVAAIHDSAAAMGAASPVVLQNDTRGVLYPIIVTPLRDPSYTPTSQSDHTRSLMLISGRARYELAVTYNNRVDIEVQYFGSFHQATFASLVAAVVRSQRNPLQVGLYIGAYKSAYEAERQAALQAGEAEFPELPPDYEIAKMLKMSPGAFSVYERIPGQPEDIRRLVVSGRLTFRDLQQLVAIPDERARIERAQLIAAGRIDPLPSPDSHAARRAHDRPPGRDQAIALPSFETSQVSGLLIPRLPRTGPAALAFCLSDAHKMLQHIASQRAAKDLPPEIRRIMKAMATPAFQVWVRQMAESQHPAS
jgi:hypothetical protein